MESNFSYKDITKELLNPDKEELYLNKRTILSHMIKDLPQTPCADIAISDWLPGDDNLEVEYAFYESPFGEVLIANTVKGICYLGVENDSREYMIKDFRKRFRYTHPKEVKTPQQKIALNYLDGIMNEHLPFHLRGTSYQTEVWRQLLLIPSGKVISYVTLAGNKQQARAAGTANGRNPVFYLIPCHRVVCSNGTFDRYSWGKEIKKRLLAWEFANSIRSLA